MSKFQVVKGITDNLEETPYIEGKVYFTYDNAESQNIVIYADIDGVRRKIKEGVQRDELDDYLLKTDIADWAKANTKPTYTAEEVGALNASHPASNVTDNKIQNWDSAYADSGKVTQTNSGATLNGYHPVLITKQNIVGDSENTDSVYKSNNLYLSSDGKLFNSYYNENGSASSLQLKPRDLEIYAGEGNQTSEKGVILKFPKISSDENQTYTCILPEKTGTIALTNDLPAVPTKTSELTNDSGFLIAETDPTVHVITLEHNWDADLDAEVISLPTGVTYEGINTWINNNEIVVLDAGSSETWRYYYFSGPDRHELIFVNPNGNQYSVYDGNTVRYHSNQYLSYSDLPTDVSQLNNDVGYITQETDPTVPAWAKEATKPTYTATEVGAVPFDAGQAMATLKGGISTLRFASTSTANQYVQAYVNTSNASITLQNQYGNSYPLVSNVQLKGIASPQDSKDAANKDYVDNAVSDKMTSTEVNSAIATAIGDINQFNVAIVSILPTENIDTHTIYFMSNGGSDDSIYDEWMYINDNWEKIGTTSIDLSGYMQTSHPANGITSTDISNWNNKTSNTGTVTSVGLTNATDGGLTVSGSPVTNSGSITVGHSNVLSSAQTTQAVYPIKIDKNGHISAYGSAVTITDEKVKQTPLNGLNSFKGLLFSNSVGNSEITNTVYTSNKIMWNDYGPDLRIYNDSDNTKYSTLAYDHLSLSNSSTSYRGRLETADITGNRTYDLPDKSGTVALTSDIPDASGYVSKSGDTMSGDLSFADGKGIELNYSGYKDKLYLIGYGPSTRTASFEYTTELRNIQTPTTNSAAANKKYVDDNIPKVYSSTNTNGYLTMATLPIYDGTVE